MPNRISKAKARNSGKSLSQERRGKRTKGVSRNNSYYNLPKSESKLKGIISRSPKKPKGYK